MTTEAALKLQLENPLDYKDKYPDVECTIHVKRCENMDIRSSTFEADFDVYLDWLDFNLVECIHYTQNVRNKKWILASWVSNNPANFNPFIRIDNAEEGGGLSVVADKAPTINRIIKTENVEGGPVQDVPWLTKKFRYQGKLSIPDCHARNFPLDVQRLPIKVVALPLEGSTTFGTKRSIKLMDPALRLWMPAEDAEKKREKFDRRKTLAHEWPRSLDGVDGGLGEMTLVAFAGTDPDLSHYKIDMIWVRDITSYIFDFIILALQVTVALFSFSVPINSDCMANRASITLTVVLTLVAFTTQRPAAIEQVPYYTIHDTYEQIMVVYCLVIAVANFIVSINCQPVIEFHDYPNDPTSGLCVEADFKFGAYPMLLLDSVLFLVILAAVFGTLMYYFVAQQIRRTAYLLLLNDELHKNDKDAMERTESRLRRVRTAFPVQKFKLRLEELEDLDKLRDHSSEFSYYWKIKTTVVICNMTLSQGFHVRKMDMGDMRPLSRATKKSFPMNFYVTNETIAGIHKRIVLRKERNMEDMIPYENEYDVYKAMRISSMPGFNTLMFKLAQLYYRNMVRCRKKEERKKKEARDKAQAQAELLWPPGIKSMMKGAFGNLIHEVTRGESNLSSDSDFSISMDEPPKFCSYDGRFDPSVETFVLDIGTGEIGFYVYWMCSKQTVVSYTPKKKYKIEEDFWKDFVFKKDAEKKFVGAKDFAKLIVNKLSDRPMPSPRAAQKKHIDLVNSNNDLGGNNIPNWVGPPHEKTPNGIDEGRTYDKIPNGVDHHHKEAQDVVLIAGCTGKHRVALVGNPNLVMDVNKFLKEVEKELAPLGFRAKIQLYVPRSNNEAEYELVATEFLVQKGDLDLSGDGIPVGPSRQRFASLEILNALMAIQADSGAECNDGVMFSGFIQEFRDLDMSYEDMRTAFDSAREYGVKMKNGNENPNYAEIPNWAAKEDLCTAIRHNGPMMRSLTRARLFGGCLSAGGGSCQLSFKSQHDDSIVLNSIPLGNRSPEQRLWPKEGEITLEMQAEWRKVIKLELEDNEIPRDLQGFYIGISAVFYAAQLANLQEKTLPTNEFLKKLEEKIPDLVKKTAPSSNHEFLDSLSTMPEKDRQDAIAKVRKDVANCILVYEWVRWVLSDKAYLCAKRNWIVESETNCSTLVATWSLGFWLRHMRAGDASTGHGHEGESSEGQSF